MLILDVILGLCLLASAGFGMAQHMYYKRVIDLLIFTQEHDMDRARKIGRVEVLQNPVVFMQTCAVMFYKNLN